MPRYNKYKSLLLKSYDEAVIYLLNKYGPANDDFFREKSYYRYLNGEIKNITKGKYSRTNEGLFCHHIDEIQELKISDQTFVKRNNIPFKYQKKDRLVYCDLIEHTILHILITKETSDEFGLPGYLTYLKPMIEDWYIEEIIPKPKWMKNCYAKSFLTPEEAINILNEMEHLIGMDYFNSLEEFYQEKQDRINEINERNKRLEKDEIERQKAIKEERKQLVKKRNIEFHNNYPMFKKINVNYDTPRSKLISLLYDIKYKNKYKNKKELDLAMKPFIRDKLLDELHSFLINQTTT